MNTKLITLASSLLAVGALVLSYGAGCGDGNTSTLPTANAPTNAVPTNAAPTNALPTNAAPTNALPTNAAPTNVSPTNAAPTNAAPTNAAPTNTTPTNTTPVAANYIDDGTIHGYCFGLQKVGTVETECDLTAGLSCPYVLPGTSWDDIAMIGCNVNQDQAGGTGSELTWVPTVGSVCIYGTGFLRIQIQGPTGDTNENDRWCSPVVDGGGCVPFTDFNTKCWDNSGNTYANEPLESVAALMPSQSDGVDVAVKEAAGTIVVTDVHVQ